MKKTFLACVGILACSMMVLTAGCAAKKAAAKDDKVTVAAQGTSYTVVKGDTLWKISNRVYGDGAKWKVIADANQDVLKGSKDLKVGMVLSIPEGACSAPSCKMANKADKAEEKVEKAAK